MTNNLLERRLASFQKKLREAREMSRKVDEMSGMSATKILILRHLSADHAAIGVKIRHICDRTDMHWHVVRAALWHLIKLKYVRRVGNYFWRTPLGDEKLREAEECAREK